MGKKTTVWSESPVVIGALFFLAAAIGFWMGHVVTFRTAYYIVQLGKEEMND